MTTTARTATDPTDFSLVLGGPLYQIWRRTGLAGDTLQLLRRRLVSITVLAWVPLLVLSATEGHAWGGGGLPFLRDVEVHSKLLLAMPLLILAELVVHRRMRPVIQQFLDRGLITAATRPRFEAAISSAMRLRNSVWAELALIVFVYVVGVGFIWRAQVALVVPSWQGAPVDGRWQPTIAGWWLVIVSLPLFQFLLIRWYFRLFIWARFLWQVSATRSPARTHPPGSMRWTGIPGIDCVRLYAPAAGARHPPLRFDCEPDLLRRRATAAVQGGFDRTRCGHGVRGPRAAAGVQPTARSRQAGGPPRVRHAGAKLRARVRPQVAARRGTCRAVRRQRRHPVAGGPWEQLRAWSRRCD